MVKSVQGLSEGFYDQGQAASAARYLTIPDRDIVADGTYYVIEEEGRIVACGGWSARRKLFTGSTDQETLSEGRLDPAADPARVRAFFVDPGYARRGLGRQLYAACEQAARAAGFRSLELMATLPGVPFYRSLGFIDAGAEDVLLPDGTPLPCLRMVREI